MILFSLRTSFVEESSKSSLVVVVVTTLPVVLRNVNEVFCLEVSGLEPTLELTEQTLNSTQISIACRENPDKNEDALEFRQKRKKILYYLCTLIFDETRKNDPQEG